MANHNPVPVGAPSSDGRPNPQHFLPLLGMHYVDNESVNYGALIRLLEPPAHLEAGDNHA